MNLKGKTILNSRQVMEQMGISENTLIKYERKRMIKVAFRLGRAKRYIDGEYLDNDTFANSRRW
jgi:transcriptional regulator with XRE-family HTH domain